MAESSPLEAAASDNVAVLRFLLEVGVNAYPGTPRFEEFRTALANHTRRAVAAPAPDRDEPNIEAITAALMNRGWMGPNAVAGWFPNNPDWIKMAKAGAQANLDSVADALRVAGVGGVPAEPQPAAECEYCDGSGTVLVQFVYGMQEVECDCRAGAVPQDRETGQ